MNLKILLFVAIVASEVESIEWDSLIEEYYPKSSLREDVFRSTRNEGSPATVTQAEVEQCIRQGDRMARSMSRIIREDAGRFGSPAERLFFTSKLSVEADMALKDSKASLLAAKILQNKLTKRGQMTPETFVGFLESKQFKTSKVKRTPHCKPHSTERTLDGSCNNVDRPLWGAANTAFTRIASTDYEDGIYDMPVDKTGNPLPSPREISSKLFKDRQMCSVFMTNLAMQWGQLVAHDLSLRAMEQAGKPKSGGIQCCRVDGSDTLQNCHPACAPIQVMANDSFYGPHGVRYLNYVRSVTVVPSDGSLGPAQQMNTVSSFIDCSPVYSSQLVKGLALRTLRGGRMKITPEGYLPPVSNVGECCDARNLGHCPCYTAGDGRINQTPLLAALQTILVREHNRLADALHDLNPHWHDERIFQEARKILIAQVQHITYHEWLPLCIGKDYIKSHKITPVGVFSYDYDQNVNPGIINSFATAAFRFFHTLIPGSFLMSSTENHQGSQIRLSDHFFKPNIIQDYPNGVEAIIRGSIIQPCKESDACCSSEITNFLFKSQNQTGIDLMAIDIQRTRDHGLARYNTYRTICGLKKAECFEDLEMEISKSRIDTLKSIYKSVDDVDLFVGGMMESGVQGSLLGPTFQCIVGEQFYRTRVGDRYFYDVADMKHSFTPDQMREIKKTTIARLICDNCEGIKNIQPRAFETVNYDNLKKRCSDYKHIPFINLKHWKEL